MTEERLEDVHQRLHVWEAGGVLLEHVTSGETAVWSVCGIDSDIQLKQLIAAFGRRSAQLQHRDFGCVNQLHCSTVVSGSQVLSEARENGDSRTAGFALPTTTDNHKV